METLTLLQGDGGMCLYLLQGDGGMCLYLTHLDLYGDGDIDPTAGWVAGCVCISMALAVF